MASLRTKAARDAKAAPKPENFCLWLPSALQRQVLCDVKLEEIERKLRIGQAYDALEELGQALRSRSYMLRFKADARISASAAKYRAAYSALSALSPLLSKVGWQHAFRCLQDDGIRSMDEGAEERPSEGRRRLSWIWTACGYGSGEKDGEQDLQGENGAELKPELIVGLKKSNYWLRNSAVCFNFPLAVEVADGEAGINRNRRFRAQGRF
ncbi:hypothetical protein EV363DRAFT_1464379 [Boletus edulis]|nr:hypothetical protein EV363DRAFT_1464379 [Boletus edulis]